jgi:tetratricopeptide (TPR) repeat protein
MQLFHQIKYAEGMKRLPESWKPYFLLLSVLLLVLTVVSDQYRPPLESTDHDSDSSHNDGHSHDPDQSQKSSNTLDKAFSQPPDPGAIPVDPVREHRMAVFHYNEGNKFLNKGNWKEAVHNYKMALHHDPALTAVYINMSNAHLKGQQYEEAKKTLDALKARTPGNPHLYYNLACYYSLTHQAAASLEALQQSIRLGYKNPNNAQSDPDLANLRQTPEFQQWVKTL